MSLFQFIPWVFTGVSLFGAYVNARGNLLVSSILWLCANVFWCFLDGSRELWAQSALYLAFILTNILGIRTAIKRRKANVGGEISSTLCSEKKCIHQWHEEAARADYPSTFFCKKCGESFRLHSSTGRAPDL